MPKPIEPTEAEQRKEALLRAVARAYGATHRAAPRAALIGGTALRIAHGLPRPSSDLDYAHRTSGEDLGKTEIPEILEAMGFKVVATMPDGKIPIRTNVVIRKAGWRNLLGATTSINVDDTRGRAWLGPVRDSALSRQRPDRRRNHRPNTDAGRHGAPTAPGPGPGATRDRGGKSRGMSRRGQREKDNALPPWDSPLCLQPTRRTSTGNRRGWRRCPSGGACLKEHSWTAPAHERWERRGRRTHHGSALRSNRRHLGPHRGRQAPHSRAESGAPPRSACASPARSSSRPRGRPRTTGRHVRRRSARP